MRGFGERFARKTGWSAKALFILLTVAPPVYFILYYASFQDFLGVASDARLLRILARSVAIAFGAAFSATSLGLVLSIFLECTRLPLSRFFQVACLSPLFIPPYISAIAWLSALGKRGGTYLFDVGFDVYNGWSVAAILALSYFPLALLIISHGLRNMDFRREEASIQVSGVFKTVFRILIPLAMPHIVISFALIFFFSLSEYGVASLLQVNVYMTEIFAQLSAFFNMGKAAVMSMPIVALNLILIYLIHRISRDTMYESVGTCRRQRNPYCLGWKSRVFGFLFCLFVLSASTIAPFSFLVYNGFGSIGRALEQANESITNSIMISLLSAFVIFLLAFFIGYFSRRLEDPLTFLPFAFPAASAGLGLILLYNTKATNLIYSGPAIIVLGFLCRNLPIAVKLFSPFYIQLDGRLEESAYLSGASFRKVLAGIIVPHMKNSFFPVAVFSFVLCIRELEVSLLLTPPGFQTLASRIFTLLHYGDIGLVSALSIIVVIIILSPILLVLGVNSFKDVISVTKRG